MLQIIPIRIAADIKPGDDLAAIIISGIKESGTGIIDKDIVVVAHKIISKAEGRIVDLADVKVSQKARSLARASKKDARLVQVILQESRRIVRAHDAVLITETHHGFVCANSGVDQSNVRGKASVVLLPLDPDRSASRLRKKLRDKFQKDVSVIITDTFGRPFRNGQTNVTIGVSGIDPIKSYIGSLDMYGRKLRVTEIAVVDEIASAAELVMGKANKVPVGIVRGYSFEGSQKSSMTSLLREKDKDLFR